METELIEVRHLAVEFVLDQPVVFADEENPAAVHDLVGWRLRFAPHQIEPARGGTLQKARARGRTLRLAAAIRCLIGSVDCDRVVRGRALEPPPPVWRRIA